MMGMGASQNDGDGLHTCASTPRSAMIYWCVYQGLPLVTHAYLYSTVLYLMLTAARIITLHTDGLATLHGWLGVSSIVLESFNVDLYSIVQH